MGESPAGLIEATLSGSPETLFSAVGALDEDGAVDLVRSIFGALDEKSTDDGHLPAGSGAARSELRLRILLYGLEKILYQQGLSERATKAYVDIFTDVLSGIKQQDMPMVVEAVYNSFCLGHGAALELIPQCLTHIMAASASVHAPPQAAINSDGSCISHFVYRDSVVNRILTVRWPSKLVLLLASSFRDIPKTMDQLKKFIRKLLLQFNFLGVEDLPALSYQLLLLSTPGVKPLILAGLVAQIDRREARARTESRAARNQLLLVEGTILMHVGFAVKQDIGIAKEWMKCLKSENRPLQPFALAMLLTLAHNKQMETVVLDYIKGVVVREQRNRIRALMCPWICEIDHPGGEKGSGFNGNGEDSRYILMMVVERSTVGWEQVAQSIVQLGSALMDLSGTSTTGISQIGGPLALRAAVSIAMDYESKGRKDDVEGCERAPGARAAATGLRILQAAFSSHSFVREPIMELCLQRLATAVKLEQCAPHARLLVAVAQSYPQFLIQYISRVKETFEHLLVTSSPAAAAILFVLRPLFTLQPDLRDYARMILRKAMFCRDTGPRVSAVQGFCFLLLEERQSRQVLQQTFNDQSASSSQACGSQMMPGGGGLTHLRRRTVQLQETVGILQRSLSYHPAVRVALYEALRGLLVVDPTMIDAVVAMILQHLQIFVDTKMMSEEGDPEDAVVQMPLRLDLCATLNNSTDGARLVEPLQHLISSCYQIISLQASGGRFPNGQSETFGDESSQLSSESYAVQELCNFFRKLQLQMGICELEDWGFDKGVDFSLAEAQGTLNLEFCAILLGVWETLLENLISELRVSDTGEAEAKIKAIEHMHGLHRRLTEMMKNKNSNDSGLKKAAKKKQKENVGAKPDTGAGGPSSFGLSGGDNLQPMMSSGCLSRILSAIVDDGTEFSAADDPSGVQQLVRSNTFQRFALETTYRLLQTVEVNCSSIENEWLSGLARNNREAEVLVQATMVKTELDWAQLGAPLFKLLETYILARCRNTGKDLTHVTDNNDGRARTSTRGTASSGNDMLLLALRAVSLWVKLNRRGTSGRAVVALELAKAFPVAGDGETEEDPGEEAFAMETAERDPARAMADRMPVLQNLAQALILAGLSREADIFCDVFHRILPFLAPDAAAKLSMWSERVCRTQNIDYKLLVVSLVSLTLQARTSTSDMAVAMSFVEGLRELLGDSDADNEDEDRVRSSAFGIIDSTTTDVVCSAVMEFVKTSLEDIEWAMNALRAAPVPSAFDVSDTTTNACDKSLRVEQEAQVYSRCEKCVNIVTQLANSYISGKPAEQLVQLATVVFRTLVSGTKLAIAPKHIVQAKPSQQLQDLANAVARHLTPSIYAFLLDKTGQEEEVDDGEETKKAAFRAKASLARIKRDERSIPSLIFQIEEYEKYIIQLTNASGVNLMRHAKRSTARDFKISTKIAACGNNDSGKGAGGTPAQKRKHSSEGDATDDNQDEPEDE